jgi:hypothetical protein
VVFLSSLGFAGLDFDFAFEFEAAGLAGVLNFEAERESLCEALAVLVLVESSVVAK